MTSLIISPFPAAVVNHNFPVVQFKAEMIRRLTARVPHSWRVFAVVSTSTADERAFFKLVSTEAKLEPEAQLKFN